MQTPRELSVRELSDEAAGLLRRWPGGKLPNHAQLSNLQAAVETAGITNLTPGDAQVVALCKEVEQAWLWECAVNRSGPRRMTYVCVAVSLLIMFLVGSLYVFYNQGAALLAEMQALSAKQPDRRFGQLERQLMIARSELFSARDIKLAAVNCPDGADSCPPPSLNEQAIDELAQEASYALLHELRDLNFSLSSLEARKNDFQKLATAPVPGLGRLWNWVSSSWTKAAPNQANAAAETDAAGASATDQTDDGASDKIADAVIEAKATKGTSEVFTTNHFCRQNEGAPDGQAVAPVQYPKVLGMDMKDIVRQACDYSLGYTSMTVPSVNLWALQVKNIIAPYAAWILPALFACLGAMIYFLRLLVDPSQPSPRINRIVHRMALAALAGVIAGWFWEPAFGANSEFQAAGLGLFTFAFIIGFGIEIFFSLLDRFVEISSSAITKLGT